ncbi:glucose 1-dehydrogenase [Natronosalvus amylolyticus]|uniref:glucose 1-dehydrogenase n=1 Tax=Natronosalvus amylolyticus TaxID=2961994 RepID=UPI0020CA13B7|nr:glucose 1-dehydrogenase [Natronosalvus amylolyticus]
MAYEFEGKAAIVTGGASGIGRAAAKRLASDGASVVVADVDRDGGESVVDGIESSGGEATFVETDVSNESSVKNLVDTTLETYGSLDMAFNNAGIEGDNEPTVDQTVDNWDCVVDVNMKGVWLCLKHEIRAMLEGEGGAIVNTSSISGQTGAGAAPYVATKHGILGLTRTAAVETAQDDIRVNAVCPGTIDTPLSQRFQEKTPEAFEQFVEMHPMGRLGEPEEIADAVAWLLSEEASFATGDMFQIDGGYMAL